MPLSLCVFEELFIFLASFLINNFLYCYLESWWESALCAWALLSLLTCKIQAWLAFSWRFFYGALTFSNLQQENPNTKEVNVQSSIYNTVCRNVGYLGLWFMF